MDELISKILPCTCTHGDTSVNQPTKAYIHQLNVDTSYSVGDVSKMNDGNRCREILKVISCYHHDLIEIKINFKISMTCKYIIKNYIFFRICLVSK